MKNVEETEEKKYYEFTFRAPLGDYYKIRGAFTEDEKNKCIDFNEGYGQSKCISINDEESLGLLTK